MYLKALEIQGFKSFPDKTVLTFGEAITAIVGPNGSGKSNLSDAVRWVMGEQSTKSLRGGKMEDVIFGGTAKRKPLGYAEVSLILDNSDGQLPMEETEIMVTRRYYRSGEGEYYINRRSCRLRDVNELFMDTGLGREGYSMIGQGRIDEILSTRSGDRRSVFEEAAGISRYRYRKEEAERRLERTRDNLLRVGDKIAELELQLEPLKQQAEKAERYLALRDQLKEIEVSLWLDNLDLLRQRIRKLQMDCDAARAQKDSSAAEQERLYARAEEIAALMRQRDVELDSLRAQAGELEQAIRQMEADTAVLDAQVKSSEENARRLTEELQAQSGRVESIARQIEQRRERLEELEQRRLEAAEAAEAVETAAAANQRQASALAEQVLRLQEQQAVRSASAGEARALLSGLAASAQELEGRKTSLKSRLKENEEQLTQFKRQRREQRQALEALQEQSQRLNNVISGHRLKLEGRQRKLSEATEAVNRLTVEFGGLNSRIHMLSEMEKLYDGYSKAVKVVMQGAERRQLTGIHGPLAGLIQVPEQYTVAVETALGGGMQNLVVSREEDGKAAIQYLKHRGAGRATFLPMSSIRPNSLREQGVEQCPGFVGVASGLVRCDRQYGNIVMNQLGRTVVAEDLDAAIAMARRYGHRFKIVTLDGQVLNPGGSMTGGSASRSAGILSRAAELEGLQKQAQTAEVRLAKSKKELESLQREVSAAGYEAEVARREKQDIDSRISKAQGESGQLRVLMNTLNDSRDQWLEELEELEERADALERQAGEARARLTELEGQAEAARAEAEGKSQGQQQFREKTEKLAERLSRLNTELAALDAERESGKQALEELLRLKQDITGDRDSREQQIARCREQAEALRAQIAEKKQSRTALQNRRSQLSDTIRRYGAERLEQEKQRVAADKAAREKNTELLNLERECSLLEQKRAGAQMEEKQIIERLWDTYELTYDSAAPQRKQIDFPTRAARQIADYKRQISALGPVNVGAIEDYQRVKERYDYLTGQRDDVEQSRLELEGIIGGITDEMKKIFRQQFDHINEAFGTTFQELFGGGTARLELEDPEDILNCGIEIRVQPPGKVLKTLTLLSGGEKAFVAIALYFAFLKVRPTPFVVMDEIEAALDDNNVARFAAYLRRMSEKTQFIAITHRRGTMEEADVLYGVTMQERGVSRMLMLNLNEAEAAIQG